MFTVRLHAQPHQPTLRLESCHVCPNSCPRSSPVLTLTNACRCAVLLSCPCTATHWCRHAPKHCCSRRASQKSSARAQPRSSAALWAAVAALARRRHATRHSRSACMRSAQVAATAVPGPLPGAAAAIRAAPDASAGGGAATQSMPLGSGYARMRGLSGSGQLVVNMPAGPPGASGVCHTWGYLLCTLLGGGLAWLDSHGAQGGCAATGYAGCGCAGLVKEEVGGSKAAGGHAG